MWEGICGASRRTEVQAQLNTCREPTDGERQAYHLLEALTFEEH